MTQPTHLAGRFALAATRHGRKRRAAHLRKLAGKAFALTWLILLGNGCQLCGERPYEIPHGTVAAPAGTATAAVASTQDMAAAQANFVLYNQNWYQGGRHLGPEGMRRLNRMIQHMPESPLPVVIEPHPIIVRPDPAQPAASEDEMYLAAVAAARELDEERRALIVATLMEAKVPDAEERVFVDYPPPGLYGSEAPLVAQQWAFPGGMMGRGRGGMMGPGIGGAAGFGGGFGGMGGGFGGMGGGFGGMGGGFGGMGGGFGTGGGFGGMGAGF